MEDRLGIVLSTVAVAGTFLWLMSKPAKPAAIVSPEPGGERIDNGQVFGNYFPSRAPRRQFSSWADLRGA